MGRHEDGGRLSAELIVGHAVVVELKSVEEVAPGQLHVSGSLSVAPESPFIGALAALLGWRFGRPRGR